MMKPMIIKQGKFVESNVLKLLEKLSSYPGKIKLD